MAAGSFCFFMPLRYGAAVLAVLQFILSAILAIALWYEVTKWSMDVGTKIAGTSAAAATYYTVLSASALVGSIAIFNRNKATLRYFAFCLGWTLGIQLAVSALQLWGYLSTSRQMLVSECIFLPGMNERSCNNAFAISVGWLIVSIVLGLLIQLCSAYVVSSYSSKLISEDEWTEQAPLPNISAPQLVSSKPTPAMIVRPHSQVVAHATFATFRKEKEWDADSSDNSSDDSDDDYDVGSLHGIIPPGVPILDPAPPKRVPRVTPLYPSGLNSGSTNSQIMAKSTNITASETSSTDITQSVVSPPGLDLPPPVFLRAPSWNPITNPGANPFLADLAKMV